jgi:hypothetical protein
MNNREEPNPASAKEQAEGSRKTRQGSGQAPGRSSGQAEPELEGKNDSGPEPEIHGRDIAGK